MGWNIDLKTDKPMNDVIIEEIIAELPISLSRGYGKQPWGWSLAVDVCLHSPLELKLSGSYGLSGQIAESAAEIFAYHLEKHNFRVIVSQIS